MPAQLGRRRLRSFTALCAAQLHHSSMPPCLPHLGATADGPECLRVRRTMRSTMAATVKPSEGRVIIATCSSWRHACPLCNICTRRRPSVCNLGHGRMLRGSAPPPRLHCPTRCAHPPVHPTNQCTPVVRVHRTPFSARPHTPMQLQGTALHPPHHSAATPRGVHATATHPSPPLSPAS